MQTRPFTPSTLAAALLLTLACPLAMAADACAVPAFSATIPDGATASSDQMNSTQVAVSEFVKAGEAFIICVEGAESATQAQRKRDDMLDQMEKVAANFNRQLRQWKKNNKG
jgi:hypothetical protein